MSRQILDTLKGGDEQPLANAKVKFTAWAMGYDAGTIPRANSITVDADQSGGIDVTLADGQYQVTVTESGGEPVYQGRITVTDSDTPATLAALIGSEEALTTAIQAAVDTAVAKALETGVVDVDGTEHTLIPDNSRAVVRFDTADPCQLLLPEQGDFREGSLFHGLNRGAGSVELAPQGLATLVGVGPVTVYDGYSFSVMVDAIDDNTGVITWRAF